MNAWISTENGINNGFFNGKKKKKAEFPIFWKTLGKLVTVLQNSSSWTL